MNRRRLIAAVLAGCISMPVTHGVAQTPTVERGALDIAWNGYGASADDMVRSVFTRVSLWPDEDDAAWFQRHLAGEAGSDLPAGEFYQSEVEEWAVPGVPDDLVVIAMEWSTTVGVAAYHTAWLLFTMRRGAQVWDLWISAAGREQARDLASDLMVELGERVPPPCGTLELEEYLPTPEDVPAGMSVVGNPAEQPREDDEWLDIPVAPMGPSATPVDSGCGAPG